jgi:hypothetical protein
MAPTNATSTKARGQEKRSRVISAERYRVQRARTSGNERERAGTNIGYSTLQYSNIPSLRPAQIDDEYEDEACDDEGPKKIQPPVSAGYEGLLFPPEQSEKIFVGIVAQVSGYFK